MERQKRTWVIVLSFVFAFLLTPIPLPDWALPWRPAWVAMVLIYWCMALPERIGVLTGWAIGIMLDVMNGSILGQHAFGLAFIAFITLEYHRRVRMFPLTQQALFVGMLTFVYLVIMLWIYNALGSHVYGMDYLLATLTTALLWPWVFVILRDVRRRAKVV